MLHPSCCSFQTRFRSLGVVTPHTETELIQRKMSRLAKIMPVEVFPVVAVVSAGCVLSGAILWHNFKNSNDIVFDRRKKWPFLSDGADAKLVHETFLRPGKENPDRRVEH